MKSFYPILVLFISTIIFVSCNQSNQPENNDKAMKSDSITNPLLEEFNTPFHVAPFDKIKVEHYIPAIKAAIEAQNQEIQAIITNPEAPNFENTLVAFDNSGELLSRVSGVFDNLSSSMLTDEMKAITEEIIGLISNHSSSIYLNEKLFSRIKTVYDADQSSLNKEQHALLEKVYKKFVRGGTNLSGEQKDRFKAITEKLAKLTNTFGQNVLEETNAYQLVIDKVEDLSGLPESVIAAAAETGTELNMEGKWVFTLQKPSMIPFLQYADNRDLRKNIFTAYINRANNNNEFDNKSIIQEIIKLRQEKAKILGFNNNAEFILAENMAKTPDAVFELLNKLIPPALEMAK
ncbi:MAG: peptidase M3, partial [Marinilabiliales bacterium]